MGQFFLRICQSPAVARWDTTPYHIQATSNRMVPTQNDNRQPMNFLLLLALMLVLAGVQARLPSLGGIRLEFLPALVAYSALTFKQGRAILCAFAAGCLQDALSAGPFGVTALAYAIAAWVIAGLGTALDRNLPFVPLLAGSLAAVAGALGAFCIIGVTGLAILKLTGIALLAGLITILVFLVVDA